MEIRKIFAVFAAASIVSAGVFAVGEPLSLDETTTLVHENERYVVTVTNRYEYIPNGANGTATRVYTTQAKTADGDLSKPLYFANIVDNTPKNIERLNALIITALKKAYPKDSGFLNNNPDLVPPATCAVTPDGFIAAYPEYSIAPGYLGVIEVTVPLAKVKALLTPAGAAAAVKLQPPKKPKPPKPPKEPKPDASKPAPPASTFDYGSGD